jgi:peptidoglycan hydrolase-like protein with peptidoglycan-binding domain
MSAEVLAGDLGFDLYVIDLSTVVDKYIGETEKNLDRIFTEADRVNGVLLFDEADALFGKRSEVKDARDRYANVEVAYLLQRMESFDGLAILTTNLRANVDEAFIRRLDAIVDFALPEEEHRRVLWQRHLPPAVPRSDDLDLDFLARRFKLSGGDIRNICVAAAYLAAAGSRSVRARTSSGHGREYRSRRLTVEAEFGRYMGMTRAARCAMGDRRARHVLRHPARPPNRTADAHRPGPVLRHDRSPPGRRPRHGARADGPAAIGETPRSRRSSARDVQRKPPKKTAAAPWHQSKRPVLRLGDGPMSSVAELQQALNGVVPGKPLRITGMFDADTQAHVRAYQKVKDFPFVTGVATKQTWWNLDKDAPRVVRQGSRVVLGPEKGEARGRLETGTTHPTLKIGSKGPAVEELQQKLNTVPANQVTIYLSTHGKFDKTTRIGVLDFQKSRKPPLKANGIVGKDTWAALDAVAGPVKVGRDVRLDQRSEGTVTGTTLASPAAAPGPPPGHGEHRSPVLRNTQWSRSGWATSRNWNAFVVDGLAAQGAARLRRHQVAGRRDREDHEDPEEREGDSRPTPGRHTGDTSARRTVRPPDRPPGRVQQGARRTRS